MPEPVAIERICNGVSRREGYTDFKGQFQIQIGSNVGFQDASEDDPRSMPGLGGPGTLSRGGNRGLNTMIGCEFRAVLAGFQSSIAPVRDSGEAFQIEIGTIVLKRLGGVTGATISATTMAAPRKARQAYEKACKAMRENKPDQEQKELEKAVGIDPQFATAWWMLGDLHQRQNRLEDATQSYTRAASADPQYVNPVFGLAGIAVQKKNWEDVAQFSAQAIKLNAYAFPIVYFFNAVANYNLKRLGPAEESARKYESLDTNQEHPEVRLLLSNLLLLKRDYPG
ncbi:MAG: tetratricopeptide repeat protein, partial [Candidatus Angelobacter sp.]